MAKISPKIQRISNGIDSTDVPGNTSPINDEHAVFPGIREENYKMF